MHYNPDGSIEEVPYWLDQQPLKQVKPLNPFARVEAETMAWGYGLKTAKIGIENTGIVEKMPYSTGKRNMYVNDLDEGEYIRVRGVDFASGASSFSLTAAATGSIEVSLRIDSPDGPEIGKLLIKPTGNVEKYKAFNTKVSGAKGIHDLYITFGKRTGEVRLDWWKCGK